jgi:hypothetical protein
VRVKLPGKRHEARLTRQEAALLLEKQWRVTYTEVPACCGEVPEWLNGAAC